MGSRMEWVCLFLVLAPLPVIAQSALDLRVYYALVGESQGISVTLGLDALILGKDVLHKMSEIDGEDVESRKADEESLTQALLPRADLFRFNVEVTNTTDHAIDLSPFTDVLIFSHGEAESQTQLRPDPSAIASYPVKIFPHSRVSIQFPANSQDDKIRAVNTAIYLSGWNFGLTYSVAKWMKDNNKRGDDGRKYLAATLATRLPELQKVLAGELSLGSADVDIPFHVEATVSDDQEPSSESDHAKSSS